MERNQLAAARELLDRGYGRPLQMIDASVLRKKLNELTPDEITALEAQKTHFPSSAHFAGGNRQPAEEAARKFVQEPGDVLVASSTPAVHVA
jgi:hypothetical protein